MYPSKRCMLPCSPFLTRIIKKNRSRTIQLSPSSHQEPMLPTQNTKDLDWAIQALRSGSITLHDVSFYHNQPNSGSFQETENSMAIYVAESSISVGYFSHFLTALSSENAQKSLKNLEFCGTEWKASELQNLHSLLDDNNNVKQLVFKRNVFRIEGLSEVSDILRRNKGLEVLIFSKCQLGSSGAGFLASALRINETIKELQIWEDSIGAEGAEELSKMIEVNNTLKLLIISDTHSITATPVISAAIARNRTMETHIWNNDDSNGQSKVAEFASENSALRIYKHSISNVQRVTGALTLNMTVKILDLTGLQLNSKWAREFRGVLEHNKSLKDIILSRTSLRDEAVVYIAAGLFKNQNVENMRLDGNWFGGVGLEHLLCPLTRFSAQIDQGNKILKTIAFGGGKTKMHGDGVAAILQLIKTNQTITRLEICQDRSLKSRDIVKIFQSLERNVTLKHLSLKGCKGVEGESVLQTILQTLEINPWLEEIDLSGTPLENTGKIELVYKKLGQNQKTNPEQQLLCDLPLAAPSNCRVVLCGHHLCGKTAICNSVSSNFSSINLWSPIRSLVIPVDKIVRSTHIKMKIVQDDDMKITMWELPSQQKYYTLCDLLFPMSGSPSLFLIITSLLKKPDTDEMKKTEDIESDLSFWLKFIVSNSRRQQAIMLPHVTIVFTHIDKMSHQSENLQTIATLVDILREKFMGFVEFYPTVFTVDARSSVSSSKLAHHLRKTSRTILERAPQVYKLCNDLVKIFREWRSENNKKPVMKWNEFCDLCQLKVPALRIRWRQGEAAVQLRRCAVANSLHHAGEVIFFEELGFIILDFEWFYGEVLIRLFKLDIAKNKVSKRNGFVSKKELEKKIHSILHRTIPGMSSNIFDNLKGQDLINMMLKLELAYEQEAGQPNSLLLLPVILEEGKGQPQKWHLSSSGCVYVGRHMECDYASHMFLTAGFFPRLQVHLHNKIYKSNKIQSATYSLEKHLIGVAIDGTYVRVELEGHLGHSVDILACSTKSVTEVLRLIQQLIIPTIHSLCHGVNLKENIIRPECVKHLIPPRFRKDQYISVQKLKQALLSLPAERLYDYQHAWNSVSDGTNLILQSGFDYARDLLSDEEFREVLHCRYYDLQYLATELIVESDNGHNQKPIVGNKSDNTVEASLFGIAKGVEAILQRLKIIESEIQNIKQEIRSLKYYEHQLLLELHQKMDYIINFNIQLEERKIPCMFYFVRIENNSKSLVTRIISGLTALRLHMLCEFWREMHVVENQIGCELMQVDNQTVRCLLPYMSKFMKLLTFAIKIGAHFIAGMGEIIPDLSREVAHLVNSPAVFRTATMAGGAVGGIFVGQAIANATSRGRNVTLGREGPRNVEQDIIAARQWLTDFMKHNKMLSGKDIAEKFGLWRVRHKRDGQIAWICRRHREMRANEIIEMPF